MRFSVVVIFLFITVVFCSNQSSSEKRTAEGSKTNSDSVKLVFKTLGLNGVMDYRVFKTAWNVSNSLLFENEKYLTIIDYSKASTEKRFYLIDKVGRELIYNEYIAHGMNTGADKALHFSNEAGSQKSSLGFFRTAESYVGKNGYSMRLDGLEKGINNNARSRAIVIHGAWYVSSEFISENGRLGRSWGCPALVQSVSREIIDLIKGGSCVFIYADDSEYKTKSELYISENE
ncbi:MAG: murein L,D-transpeptidase catalytic domain family protein [Bacteroidota bacterium]|nr:murein L,D-transpeptidase catalytic domain family protein [Bacteroidota bacterium]